MTICKQCGKNVPDNMKFCVNCGIQVSSICQYCGQPNPPSINFCGHCGKPIEKPTEPQLPIEEESEYQTTETLFEFEKVEEPSEAIGQEPSEYIVKEEIRYDNIEDKNRLPYQLGAIIYIGSLILLVSFFLSMVKGSEWDSQFGIAIPFSIKGYELANGEFGPAFPIFFIPLIIGILAIFLPLFYSKWSFYLIILLGVGSVICSCIGYWQVYNNITNSDFPLHSFMLDYGLIVAILGGLMLAFGGFLSSNHFDEELTAITGKKK